MKTDISGQPLNKNGYSPHANRQVNKFNKEHGKDIYAARIMGEFENRLSALKWEQENTNRLSDEGKTMIKHIRSSY